jgi:hypothetical protein
MLLALGVALLLGDPVAPDARAGVPAEIAAHYRDYNFVNAFSTLAERRLLARSPEPPPDERRRHVARVLARLVSRTDEIDAGITPWRDPARVPPHESEFRTDVVRITSWRVDDRKGEAWIELDVLTLEEGSSVVLVTAYDRLTRGGTRMPDVDEMVAMMWRPPSRTVERHHWLRIGGEWRRNAAAFIFLAQ